MEFNDILRLGVCCAGMCAAVSLFGQGTEPLPMDTALRYGVLENGLTYYIRENRTDAERADFYIVQNVGAILEEDGQNGLAHFLEHMAFNGTEHFPGKGIISYLEGMGVMFGADINAYTAQDETVYNLKNVPTGRWGTVDSCLMVLRDWSGRILLEDGEIEKERGVILEEWRTRNTADRRLWKESSRVLYEGCRYAERDIIGDTGVIMRFHPDTLRAFYKRWYGPDLQAVIVVGDVDGAKVEKRVRELFGDAPKREGAVKRPLVRLPRLEKPRYCALTDAEAKYTRIAITYRHSPLPDRVHASAAGVAIGIANDLIDAMLGARMDEVMMEKETPFAYLGAGYGEMVKSADAFEVNAVSADGRCREALERMTMEMERARRHGFLQSELDRAKADMLSAYEKAYNERNKTKNNAYVREYKANYLDFEPVPGIETEKAIAEMVLAQTTVEDLNKMMRERMETDQMTVLITAPEKEKAGLPSEAEALAMCDKKEKDGIDAYVDKMPNEPLVAKLPKVGKIKKRTKEAKSGAEVWTLSNGAKVVILPTKLKDDEIKMYAYCNGGRSAIDDEGELPSAMFADAIAGMSGAGKFDMLMLQKALAGKTVSIDTDLNLYASIIKGGSGKKDFRTLMELVYLKQTGAREDSTAYLSLMSQYATALRNKALDPKGHFRDSVSYITYGRSAYVQPMNTGVLEKVSMGKAMEVYKMAYSAVQGYTYVFVGNIDAEEAKEDILTFIGGQKGSKEKRVGSVDRGAHFPKGEVKVDFAVEQKVDRSSNYLCMSRDAEYSVKNYVVARIAAAILDYRYLESCREDEGGTYGVSVQARSTVFPKESTALLITFDTNPEKEETLKRIVREEMEKIAKDGPREDDLQKAKEAQVKIRKDKMQTNGGVIDQLVQEVRYGKGFFFEEGYEKVVVDVSGEDVREYVKGMLGSENEIEVRMRKKKE